MQFGTELSEDQLEHIQNNDLTNAVPKLRKSKDCIDRAEFVLIVLHLMDRLRIEDVAYISEIFDTLDHRAEGFKASTFSPH